MLVELFGFVIFYPLIGGLSSLTSPQTNTVVYKMSSLVVVRKSPSCSRSKLDIDHQPFSPLYVILCAVFVAHIVGSTGHGAQQLCLPDAFNLFAFCTLITKHFTASFHFELERLGS